MIDRPHILRPQRVQAECVFQIGEKQFLVLLLVIQPQFE